MPIFLNGLGLQNYRGIGDSEQLMAPFRSFNIFIGANNSGKSAPLNFISTYLSGLTSGKDIQVSGPLEIHGGASAINVSLAVPRDELLKSIMGNKDAPQAQILSRLVTGLSDGDHILVELGSE